jgi:hypothetical protein
MAIPDLNTQLPSGQESETILPWNELGNLSAEQILSCSDSIFLFRIWRKNCTSVGLDERGFVAHLFSHQNDHLKAILDFREEHGNATDVTPHVLRQTLTSPFVSTTLSLHWAIANALQISKSKEARGQEINISVINFAKLEKQDLRVPARDVQDGDAYKFANQSQEVLVFGRIPEHTILATIELKALLKVLLDWFNPTTEDIPYDTWGKSGRAPCRVYANTWVEKFWADKTARTQHEVQCVELAKAIVVPDVTSGFKSKDDIKLLASYLYRWPFRWPFRAMKWLDPLPTFKETSRIIEGAYVRLESELRCISSFIAICVASSPLPFQSIAAMAQMMSSMDISKSSESPIGSHA